jgi:hypothetical protein
MKKYQLKERGLILVSFAMTKEGFRLLNLEPMEIDLTKFEDIYDVKLIILYKKLYKLNKMFATKRVLNFVDKRLSAVEDNIERECQPLYIGLLVLYFYFKSDCKKDLVISEVSYKDIEKIVLDHHNEYRISRCTINKAVELYSAIYPDMEGYIEFLKMSSRFPFNLV